METKRIIKGNQEQAVGAWINYLNQVRLDRLVEQLAENKENLTAAIMTVDTALETIKETIIDRNRGGSKGMHGFIAEIAECGIGNARQQINGNEAKYSWINDNSPTDLIRDGIDIQQKFVNAGNHLSLKAISEHLNKYPDYVDDGGIYQIPEDHYQKIKQLLDIPKEVANKMPTSDGTFSLRQWKEVHQFFEEGNIPIDKIEPSELSYDSVQANQIEITLEGEKQGLRSTNEVNNKVGYEESLPSLAEGVKVTAISGVIEGGTALCMSVVKKKKAGKRIKDFDINDWKDIAGEAGVGTFKGVVRGATIYSLTNFTATPAAVASSLVTASFGMAEQIHLYRLGSLDQVQLIENSEILCLDASISALSSFVGQAIIPVPVLGAVIGNTVGTVMYQIGKDKFSAKEQEILKSYAESLRILDDSLQQEYQEVITLLIKDIEVYMAVLEEAFSTDVNVAFKGSVKLAQQYGVPYDEILDTKEKVYSYFME